MQNHRISVFGTIKKLTTAAMLTAISVVIGIICKNFLNFGGGLFRITFENLPIIMAGLLFGPVVGGAVGFCSDVISYALSVQSFAISPIVSLAAALIGIVSGVVSKYIIKKRSVLQVAVAGMSAHIVGSMIVKSIGLFVYFGWAVLWRIPTYLVIAPLEITLICLLMRHKSFAKFISDMERG